MQHVPYVLMRLSPFLSIQEAFLPKKELKQIFRRYQGIMIKLTPLHLDIIDVHNCDIACTLPFCMLLLGSPSCGGSFAC